MSQSVSFNPLLTTNAGGTFNIQSQGYIQGMAMDDPAIRHTLAGGVLALTETLPMWGGVAIYEQTPNTVNGGTAGVLGGQVGRATGLTGALGLTGFSVFNQAHHMIATPQSQVPLALPGMSVHFHRMNSGARIAVNIDPSLINLEGNIINQNVSWDFINQRLQPYVASGATQAITSMTWAATSGGQAAVVMTAPSVFGLGDTVNITGATNAGTGGAASVNGSFVINTFTDSSHFTIAMPAAAGVVGAIASTPVINVGTGILPVKIIDVIIGNCMTVNYLPPGNFASWNRAGSCAVIVI